MEVFTYIPNHHYINQLSSILPKDRWIGTIIINVVLVGLKSVVKANNTCF